MTTWILYCHCLYQNCICYFAVGNLVCEINEIHAKCHSDRWTERVQFVVMICDVICGVPENSTKDLTVVAAMRRRQLQDIVSEAQCSIPFKRRYFSDVS